MFDFIFGNMINMYIFYKRNYVYTFSDKNNEFYEFFKTNVMYSNFFAYPYKI